MGEETVSWTVDLALLEDGPCAGHIVEVEAALPLHLVVRYGPRPQDNITYRKQMNGEHASRNDQGQIRYRVSDNQ